MLLNRKTLLLQGQRPRRTHKVRPGDILITRRANQQRIAALVLNYRLTWSPVQGPPDHGSPPVFQGLNSTVTPPTNSMKLIDGLG